MRKLCKRLGGERSIFLMATGDSSLAAMPISHVPYVGLVVSNSSYVPTFVGSMDIVLLKPSF